MNHEEAEKHLFSAVERLGEHFDAVQILVSWNEEANTKSLYRGSGNWFARQGMAREFIVIDTAQEHAHQLAARIKDQEQ